MTINDFIKVNGQLSVDGKAYQYDGTAHRPWSTVAEFLAATPAPLRHVGQIAFILNGTSQDIWYFENGIADADFKKYIGPGQTVVSLLFFNTDSDLPASGNIDKLYVVKSTKALKIWDGTAYVHAGNPGPIGPIGPTGATGATGAIGATGADGDSAYQVWLDAGNVGTVNDFLYSLIGPQGPQGEKGDKGDQGDAGPQITLRTNSVDNSNQLLLNLVDSPTLEFEYTAPGIVKGNVIGGGANLIIRINTLTPGGILASKAALTSALTISPGQMPVIDMFELINTGGGPVLYITVKGLRQLPDSLFEGNNEITEFIDLTGELREIGTNAFRASSLYKFYSQAVETTHDSSFAIAADGFGKYSLTLIVPNLMSSKVIGSLTGLSVPIDTGKIITWDTIPGLVISGTAAYYQVNRDLSTKASGTNTYTATVSGLSSYTGLIIDVTFTNANTVAATLNINSLGAIAITKNGGGALVAGDIAANSAFRLLYNGTSFEVVGKVADVNKAYVDAQIANDIFNYYNFS